MTIVVKFKTKDGKGGFMISEKGDTMEEITRILTEKYGERLESIERLN